MIRLTLIISTYNRCDSLLRTLRSVVGQGVAPECWECIVVNNNSTDHTAAAFAEFAAHYSTLNLRLVDEPMQGLSHARNRGIAEAHGDILAIIDDDETINRDFVASYIDLFDHYPADAAGGRIIAAYDEGRPRWMSPYVERPIANPMEFGNEVRPFPAGKIPGGGNMALRRSTIERIGGFDPALGRTGKSLIGGEENDLFERLRKASGQIYYAPDAVIWHHIPPQKLTAEYRRNLAYKVGVTQRTMAQRAGTLASARIRECAKWVATLAIALLYTLTLRPCRAIALVAMRLNISRGLFSRNDK